MKIFSGGRVNPSYSAPELYFPYAPELYFPYAPELYFPYASSR